MKKGEEKRGPSNSGNQPARGEKQETFRVRLTFDGKLRKNHTKGAPIKVDEKVDTRPVCNHTKPIEPHRRRDRSMLTTSIRKTRMRGISKVKFREEQGPGVL